MDGGPAVAHHENIFGVREQHLQVVHGLERQRVFVAQPGGRDPVPGDHFEYERSDRRVDHFLGDAGFLEPQRFFGRLVPVVAHLQDSRHHPGFLATPAHGQRSGRKTIQLHYVHVRFSWFYMHTILCRVFWNRRIFKTHFEGNAILVKSLSDYFGVGKGPYRLCFFV